MRYEEYEIFEEGDRVEIDDCSDYCGCIGTVIEDQIDPMFIVKVKLYNGKIIFRSAEYLVLIE